MGQLKLCRQSKTVSLIWFDKITSICHSLRSQESQEREKDVSIFKSWHAGLPSKDENIMTTYNSLI